MKRKLFVLGLMLMTGALSFAQQSTGKSRQPKKAESIVEASSPRPSQTAPQTQFAPIFFEGSTSLAAYQANDPAKIFDWLTKYIAGIPGKPDQFSTSDEKRIYESTLAGRMQAVAPIPMVGKCAKKYDGDRELYEIKASAHSLKNYYSIKEVDAKAQNVKAVSLSSENLKKDSYTGQNAYGAETQISRTIADVYALAFPLSKAPPSIIVDGQTRLTNLALPYDVDFKYLQLNFQMSASDARANDKDIACLFIFSIAPPYIFKYNERMAPTRDLPFEYTSNYYAIYGSLDQVVVFNKATGSLYEQAAR